MTAWRSAPLRKQVWGMELVCADPNAKILAQDLKQVVAAFGLLPSVHRTLLLRHGIELEGLADEALVPLQPWLAALGELRDILGRDSMRVCGRKIIHGAVIPPFIDCLGTALDKLNDLYYYNHRGDVGRYDVRSIGAEAWEISCATPYPPELEHGLIEGFASHKPLIGRNRYSVGYKAGDYKPYSCVITVRLEP